MLPEVVAAACRNVCRRARVVWRKVYTVKKNQTRNNVERSLERTYIAWIRSAALD
jgi:hypothetical protein